MFQKNRDVRFLWISLFLLTMIFADPNHGRIQGMLVTSEDQIKYVGRAVVFLCDSETGRPFHSGTRTLFTANHSTDEIWCAVTTHQSDFNFENVPPGTYRLFAQSWMGTEGLPKNNATSEVILLHGTAESFQVQADQTTQVFLRPLGNRMLTIENDPSEAGAFLFISTAPTLGDPILGFYGWGESFMQHIIGVTHMSLPRATFLGLPEDCELYLALFCYDNVPGFGGTTVQKDQKKTVSIKIYAGWSNGHDDPPNELLPLVEYLEKNNPLLTDILQLTPHEDFLDTQGHLNYEKLWEIAKKNRDQKIAIADLGAFSLLDILAAEAYKRLRAHHQLQKKK